MRLEETGNYRSKGPGMAELGGKTYPVNIWQSGGKAFCLMQNAVRWLVWSVPKGIYVEVV